MELAIRPSSSVFLVVGLAIALGFLSTRAAAESWIAQSAFAEKQLFVSTAGPQLLEVGPGEATSLRVDTSIAANLAVLLSAECVVAATTMSSWVSLEILVDGTPIPPSGIDHAFCTSDGDGDLDSAVTAALDLRIQVFPGSHEISVRGRQNNGSGSWRIGNLSLIVLVVGQ